jgi:hypothetical protein
LSGLPEVAGVILLFAVIWVILLAALSWTKELDVFVTYSFRKRSNIIAVGASVVLLAIWGFIAVILGILGAQIWRQSREVGYWIISFALIGLPSIIFVALYALRGFRNIIVDRCYGEGGFRIGFAIFVLAIFAWWSVSFKSL